MTTDLWALVGTSIWLVILTFIPSGARTIKGGLAYGAGNRDVPPPETGAWVSRADRAQRNLLENFPHFAALVLVAHVAGVANEMTGAGATLFLGARLAHAALYIIGIPYWRTIAYFIGLAGEGIILSRLFV